MALIDEALKYFKGKPVVVVTSLESEGYLQEIVGILLDGAEDCLVLQQEDEESPTIVNVAHIAWIFEETGDEEDEEE